MNREEFIAAVQTAKAKRKPIAVSIKDWGTVYVRSLTVAEAEANRMEEVKEDDPYRIVRALSRLLCDADGTRLFDSENKQDLSLLKELLADEAWGDVIKIVSALDSAAQETVEGN